MRVGGAPLEVNMHRATVIIVASALLLAFAAATQAETRRGGPGSDTFSGTPKRDWYWGRAGNDFLVGLDASDHLYGGTGEDALRGGRASDRIYAGRGADRAHAGPGADHVYGGPGNDRLFAFADDGAVDVIDCGRGAGDYARVRLGDNTLNCETVETVS
jgi:Ca2+-binding RTX toxin-like protein